LTLKKTPTPKKELALGIAAIAWYLQLY